MKKLTNKERFEQIEEKIITNSNAIMNMRDGRKALVQEWRVYENNYREYLKKRNRFRNFLWRLWCKVTFRSVKLTEKELTKYIAKKMARVFYKGGHR